MPAHPKYRDIEVRGVIYPTTTDVMRELGVSRSTVLGAIVNGTLDTLGLGRGRRVRMPVRMRGRIYDNAAEAAVAANVSVHAIYRALAHGYIDRVGLPPDRRRCGGGNSRTVIIGGVHFPSIAAMARALGRSPSHLCVVLNHGTRRQREALLADVMALEARQMRQRQAVAA